MARHPEQSQYGTAAPLASTGSALLRTADVCWQPTCTAADSLLLVSTAASAGEVVHTCSWPGTVLCTE
jgi:hypothetical protein